MQSSPHLAMAHRTSRHAVVHYAHLLVSVPDAVSGSLTHGVTSLDATSDPAHMPGAQDDPGGITLCVVNFNGESLLADTLRAAECVSPPPREILVVDNASDDGSVSLVERDFPHV